MYPAAGHIMTGNLKIISDSRIRYIVSKGAKYRFPSRIDFKKCREEIASALNDFGNRWCKCEYVEPDALKEWKVSIFKIVDQRIKFYSQNTNLLPPKPKSTFRHLNFPFLDGDVPRSTSYGVYISQLIRFARVSSHVTDFNAHNKSLTAKFLQQGYRYHKLRFWLSLPGDCRVTDEALLAETT